MNTENVQDAPVGDVEVESPSVNTEINDVSSAPGDVTPTDSPEAGADGEVAAAPAYQPNFKYKAALEERELDEFWRPLVKDADSEKKVKELFTKVDAFDFVKTRKEHVEEQYEALAGDYDHLSSTVKNVEDSLNKGDLTSVFRQLNVTKEQIFKWTQDQINRMEMPPEERQRIEQYEQAQLHNQTLEQKFSTLESKYQNQAVQARTMQLDMVLSRPDVSQFSQAWDANGGQGSFRNFVVEEAKKVFYETQMDLSPEQAVNQVMQRFGKFLNMGDSMTQAPQALNSMQVQQQKPVIPNITGKAASPIKKVPKTLDDLKKLAKQASMSS